MRRFTCACLLPLFSALPPAGAAAEECNPRFAKSPQFVAKDCTFQNLPNPDAKPHRSTWDIWTRILLEKKQGTFPIDPIPVRTMDRAALAALATPEIGEVLTLGKPRENKRWWEGLR